MAPLGAQRILRMAWKEVPQARAQVTLLRQEGWTKWPTEVPSNPCHSVILWKCQSKGFAQGGVWQCWGGKVGGPQGLSGACHYNTNHCFPTTLIWFGKKKKNKNTQHKNQEKNPSAMKETFQRQVQPSGIKLPLTANRSQLPKCYFCLWKSTLSIVLPPKGWPEFNLSLERFPYRPQNHTLISQVFELPI